MKPSAEEQVLEVMNNIKRGTFKDVAPLLPDLWPRQVSKALSALYKKGKIKLVAKKKYKLGNNVINWANVYEV